MTLRLLVLFVLPALAYVVLGVNLRALTRGKFLLAGTSEMLYALMNFVIIRRVTEAQGWVEAVCYACGATVGSLGAMWLTRHWDR